MLRTLINRFSLRIGSEAPIAAVTPCSVYSLLVGAGKMADPNYGKNAGTAVEYAKMPCEFSTVFYVDEYLLGYRTVRLSFGGILGDCRVLLNDTEICRVRDFFHTYTVDVRDALEKGENRLRFCFEPGYSGHSVRTPACFAGGRICPPVFDSGIFGAVRLLAHSGAAIDGIRLTQKHEEDGTVRLHIESEIVGSIPSPRVVASLRSPSGKTYFAGLTGGVGDLPVSDPELWHPLSFGAPNVYRLTLTLYDESEPIDEFLTTVGLRYVTVTADTFCENSLCINGTPVLMKTAEVLPEQIVTPLLGAADPEPWLRDASEAGICTVRIPNDTCYASEKFLDACDRLGIMVIQEIPTPMADRDTLLEELSAELPRLALHPSVIGISHRCKEGEDTVPIYDAVERTMPNIPFFYVFETDRPDGVATLSVPMADGSAVGTVITVGSGISLPVRETVNAFCPPSSRNVYSEVMEFHAKGESLAGRFADAAERYPYAGTLDEQIYLTQYNAAYAARTMIDNVRRNRTCHAGIVVGMYNEAWRGILPSMVDADGRKKILYYFLKRAFAPASLSLSQNGYRISFCVANDLDRALDAKVVYTLADRDNHVVAENTREVRVDAATSGEVFSVDFSTRIFSQENEYYVTASLFGREGLLSTRTTLFVPPKYFRFADPAFGAEVRGSGRAFELELTASAFAPCVTVAFDGVNARFSDNAFDMTKPLPVRIPFTVEEDGLDPQELKRRLRISCFNTFGARDHS